MKYLYYPLLGASLFLATSCGVTKKTPPAATTSSSRTLGVEAPLLERLQERLTATPDYAPALRGNLQAEIRLGKEQLSTKIHATILPGKMIYWSIVPFPLIEAARVWFTSEGVTAVDRMHGRYAEVSYEELSQLVGFPIHYIEVERLLLGKPFLPEGTRGLRGGGYSVTEASDSSSQIDALWTVSGGRAQGKYQLSWTLSPELRPNTFSVQQAMTPQRPLFRLVYTHSPEASARELPQTTALFLGASASELPALTLDWGRLRPFTGTLPDLTPRVKDSYQRMTLPELIKLLPSL